MGLLTKITTTKWHGSTKKYYESKGYIYTKIGDEFEVRVEDLMDNSTMLVEVKCDCEDCKTQINKPMTWQKYKKYVKSDGKYYCRKCAMKLFATKKTRETKLKNSKSFEQWCHYNLDIDYANEILSRWDIKKNGCLPSEVGYKSNGINKKGFWFKCPRGIHKSEQKRITGFVRNYSKGIIDTRILQCNKCNSFGQYLIDTYGENALDLYWSDKNLINPFNIPKMWNNKIWIKCQDTDYHEDYPTYCDNFIKGGRCTFCEHRGGKVHPLDSLGQYIINKFGEDFLNSIWSDKNDKSAFEYAPMSNEYVWFRCLDGKHEDSYKSISNSYSSNFRCSNCIRERDESILQEKTRLYIEKLGYTILHEHNCTIIPKNPKTKLNMPFDNEIKELRLVIEVMGIQHTKINGFHKAQAKRNNTTPEYEFHMQQVRDRYKRIYAKMNGYSYLEIPHTSDNNTEEWKILIDNKIQEICTSTIKSITLG